MAAVRKKPKPGPGRKSRYRPEYADQAKLACAEGGFTDAKLAKLFGVSKATVVLWRQTHEEFAAACRDGKDAFAVATAEESLLKRVKGYSYFEDTFKPVFALDDGDEDGAQLPPEGLTVATDRLILVKRVKRHVTPDVGAQRFVLTNLARNRWAERQKAEVTGELGITHSVPEELASLVTRIFQGTE